MAALTYAFNSENGETPQTLVERRRLADTLAAKLIGSTPKNMGEGIGAIGDALSIRFMRGDLDKAQKDGAGRGEDAWADFIKDKIAGSTGSAAPAPASIPSEAMSGAPVGDTAAPLSGGLMQAGPAGSPYAGAISSIESGGKYDTLGPVTGSGDRAYGKYQVMGANIPQWTKTHLGQEMTPEQFLQNPQAQDAVFNGEFGRLAQKHGPEGAAKAWFAGEKGMNNPGAADVLGTTVSGYADKFRKALAGPQVASLDPTAGMATQPKPMMPANATAFNGQPQDSNPLANASSFAPQPQGATPPAAGGLTPSPPGQPNITMAQTRPVTPPIGAQPQPRAVAQTAPGQGPSLADLLKAKSNPWLMANPGHAAYVKAALEQKMKEQQLANDPLHQLQIQQAQKTLKKPDSPSSVQEYEYYRKDVAAGEKPMDYATWSTARARAGATNISNNVDMNSGMTYDKQLAEGLGKAHAALSNDVENAQARARDIAAMQGAVDAIQKNGGTLGGMGQAQVLDLKKTINAGASAFGITTPFDEGAISDKEFLQKFNRQIAGQQAKNAVGARVTNVEMSNYLKANPGLDMSVTGNQRLLGIQSQIEQRNIAVGNEIRNATAQAISKGQKIDPVTVQKIVHEYDEKNHISDPVNGQDLTQSYTLPEFQKAGTNNALSNQNKENIGKIRRYNPATGMLE